jgi:CRP/FNR family cyclic AMP-dependent transcriptional regulator
MERVLSDHSRDQIIHIHEKAMRSVLYFLGLLTDGDIDWLAVNGERLQVPPGTVLLEEGGPLSALYLILEGTLEVRVSQPQPRVINTLGPGQIVGEVSFVDARPPSATVAASSPTVVLRLSREVVNARLKSDVGFAARFYQALAVFLADRLRQTLTAARSSGGGSSSPATDELSEELLENLSLAGSRYDWVLKRLLGRH